MTSCRLSPVGLQKVSWRSTETIGSPSALTSVPPVEDGGRGVGVGTHRRLVVSSNDLVDGGLSYFVKSQFLSFGLNVSVRVTFRR